MAFFVIFSTKVTPPPQLRSNDPLNKTLISGGGNIAKNPRTHQISDGNRQHNNPQIANAQHGPTNGHGQAFRFGQPECGSGHVQLHFDAVLGPVGAWHHLHLAVHVGEQLLLLQCLHSGGCSDESDFSVFGVNETWVWSPKRVPQTGKSASWQSGISPTASV